MSSEEDETKVLLNSECVHEEVNYDSVEYRISTSTDETIKLVEFDCNNPSAVEMIRRRLQDPRDFSKLSIELKKDISEETLISFCDRLMHLLKLRHKSIFHLSIFKIKSTKVLETICKAFLDPSLIVERLSFPGLPLTAENLLVINKMLDHNYFTLQLDLDDSTSIKSLLEIIDRRITRNKISMDSLIRKVKSMPSSSSSSSSSK